MIFPRILALAAFLVPLGAAAPSPSAEQPRFTAVLDNWRISYRDEPGHVHLGISIMLQGEGTFVIPSRQRPKAIRPSGFRPLFSALRRQQRNPGSPSNCRGTMETRISAASMWKEARRSCPIKTRRMKPHTSSPILSLSPRYFKLLCGIYCQSSHYPPSPEHAHRAGRHRPGPSGKMTSRFFSWLPPFPGTMMGA